MHYYAGWNADQPPTIAGPPEVTFTIGDQGSFQPTVTGSPAPTVTAAGLPAGLTIDDGTGKITGTPEPGTEGDHQVVLTAANGIDPAATLSIMITVQAAPIDGFDLAVDPGRVPERGRVETTGGGPPRSPRSCCNYAPSRWRSAPSSRRSPGPTR